MTTIQTYGPEIIAIVDAVISLAQKVKTNIEAVAPGKPVDEKRLPDALVCAISKAVAEGKPFTYSGKATGIFARRDELPDELQKLSRNKLEDMAKKLILGGKVVKRPDWGMNKKRWLDVPGGALSRRKVKK